ncbi:MAG: hypothetical protein GXX96_27850 [Planctomycetaceae bacterium]|nr:hypothetical protein [Planctomycetaceae bacterium]
MSISQYFENENPAEGTPIPTFAAGMDPTTPPSTPQAGLMQAFLQRFKLIVDNVELAEGEKLAQIAALVREYQKLVGKMPESPAPAETSESRRRNQEFRESTRSLLGLPTERGRRLAAKYLDRGPVSN